MSDLRTAAQQALEALEDMLGWQSLAPQTIQESAKGRAAALKAALVEDAMQKFTDVNQEIEAALAEDVVTHGSAWSKDGKRIDPMSVYAEPVQEPVQDGKCKHCVDGCPACDARKLPVQEPVAWRFKAMIGMPWSLSDDGYYISCKRDQRYFVEALYTSPPQRKPLTEEEIQAAWDSVDMRHPRGNETRIAFTRAIERAHGIGGQP